MTHHRVSLSSPQTEDENSMSPRAISPKGRTQHVVNLVVAGILQPLKTSGSQTILKPLRCHPSHVWFIMYHLYLLYVVYRF